MGKHQPSCRGLLRRPNPLALLLALPTLPRTRAQPHLVARRRLRRRRAPIRFLVAPAGCHAAGARRSRVSLGKHQRHIKKPPSSFRRDFALRELQFRSCRIEYSPCVEAALWLMSWFIAPRCHLWRARRERRARVHDFITFLIFMTRCASKRFPITFNTRQRFVKLI